uniref:Putative secreted protein n=1 Tax=Ixodes ricinus TaxID=34613 RepID=A0A147BW23_IXORI
MKGRAVQLFVVCPTLFCPWRRAACAMQSSLRKNTFKSTWLYTSAAIAAGASKSKVSWVSTSRPPTKKLCSLRIMSAVVVTLH